MVRKWHIEHPEASMALRISRKYKIKAVAIPASALISLLKSQNSACPYCGCELGKGKHLDHIIPLSRGGKHVITNVQYTCQPCNDSKGAKTHEEFLQYLENIAA